LPESTTHASHAATHAATHAAHAAAALALAEIVSSNVESKPMKSLGTHHEHGKQDTRVNSTHTAAAETPAAESAHIVVATHSVLVNAGIVALLLLRIGQTRPRLADVLEHLLGLQTILFRVAVLVCRIYTIQSAIARTMHEEKPNDKPGCHFKAMVR
jgi:hypothetical protein